MKLITLIFGLFLSLCLSAQNDTSVFMTIKRIEANDYIFSIPEKWKVFLMQINGPQLQRLEFTDVALPHVVNNAPLTAICLLRKLDCDSLVQGERFIVTEFTSYPDRITPPGYNYTTDTVKIASGETAILYTTHYYRRSKASNFTRYDLIVYSEKRKGAYLFGITYQYKDPTYQIEFDLKLKQYAWRVFRTFALR